MAEAQFGRSTQTDSGSTRHARLPFQFFGSGSEYFGIWIVNVLLTVLTIGIYSAWAKVRNKRYFNGQTELDGFRFDYHARPVQILKGRIIVIVVLIVMAILNQLHPILAVAVLVFYAVALPWVIIRGLRFNANMTSYRNLRFHFEDTKWRAFKANILWPFLATLSLGLLMPFASRANVRFLGNGHRFGQSRFSADPKLKPFYQALGVAMAILIAATALAALGAYTTFSRVTLIDPNNTDPAAFLAFLFQAVVFVPFYLAFFVASAAYAALARNAAFNVLALEGGHEFRSTVSVGSYCWIIVTNLILTIATIGLFIPWAKVRIARYLADNTTMLAKGDLDRFVEDQTDDRGVASGEFLDIEGIDFGF
ncbi:MAG: YjgN family protein [Ahrensia sp.]|nr:YjgN family protein [Ahrensia sp.]